MCYDLVEYDPFEALYLMRGDGELEINDEPMSDYDWEKWLENDY